MNVDNELMEFLKGLKLPTLGDIYLQGARWYKIIDYFPNYDNKTQWPLKVPNVTLMHIINYKYI